MDQVTGSTFDPATFDADAWKGRDCISVDGSSIGTIDSFVTPPGGNAWCIVKTGLLGGANCCIPTTGATIVDEQFKVPYAEDFIKDAPTFKADFGDLSDAQWKALCAYYDVPFAATDTTGRFERTSTPAATGAGAPATAL